jgi:hypothetical protein
MVAFGIDILAARRRPNRKRSFNFGKKNLLTMFEEMNRITER